MDSQNLQLEANGTYRMQANQTELAQRLARAIRSDGGAEPLKGVHLFRASQPTKLHSISIPSFCVIAQGSKEVFLANEHYQYDPAHYLLYTAELPILTQITDASPDRPYLSMRLDLDSALVGSVVAEAGRPAPRRHANVRAINVSPLDDDLLDAVVRLARLLASPSEARFLAPLVTREIIYRLLKGEQSDRLRHLAAAGGNTQRIGRAIERFRAEFDQPLHIDDVAQELGMSVSSFHHHFKAVTAMSPLQFQKQLRLQEARRLMLGERLDAASAGYRVGYDDASHFNREYKRLFGSPPLRDVERLRATAGDRTN
jgi:AraC-like DNA-binding protein